MSPEVLQGGLCRVAFVRGFRAHRLLWCGRWHWIVGLELFALHTECVYEPTTEVLVMAPVQNLMCQSYQSFEIGPVRFQSAENLQIGYQPGFREHGKRRVL